MMYIEQNMRQRGFLRVLSSILLLIFSVSVILPLDVAQAQIFQQLPLPGVMVTPTTGYVPALIRGIEIYPHNPLAFNFIVDSGHSGLEGEALNEETLRLVKYFLAALTVPQEEMWVNLSPYEENRIIPESFGLTTMGVDLLAQDYILKQLTASLMYPEEEIGREFWSRLYAHAQRELGTAAVPMDAFHKVWIVPDQAVVYEKDRIAFVAQSRLRVMMEQDYYAMSQNHSQTEEAETIVGGSALTELQLEVMRDVILPAIEKEVNEGKNFANLRQVYNSMILAAWFKQNLRESLLGQIYVDQNKINGINIDDTQAKEKIYQQYVQAFEQGVYNYIREDVDPLTEQVIPRHYFSGGFDGRELGKRLTTTSGPGFNPAVNNPSATIGSFHVNLVEDTWSSSPISSSDQEEPVRLRESSRELMRKFAPQFLALLDQGKMNLRPHHIKAIHILTDINGLHFLDESTNPLGLLDQIALRDQTYPHGLLKYKQEAAKLMKAWHDAVNAKSDSSSESDDVFMPDVLSLDRAPEVDLTTADIETMRDLMQRGLGVVNKYMFGLVAGGLGERLDYGGLKVELPLDSLNRKPYLQRYVEEILALQKRSNELTGQNERIPLIMMTSDDNHYRTVKFVEDNHLFGMEGLTVIDINKEIAVYDSVSGKVVLVDREAYFHDSNSRKNQREVGQIIIFKQDSVLAFRGPTAEFILTKEGLLEEKPHNHGDMELLLYRSRLSKAFLHAGKAGTLFFQDTNGQTFNAVLPGLGVLQKQGYGVNLLAVERKPGDAIGVIARMKKNDGTFEIGNIEYSEINRAVKKYGILEAEFSSGNINIIAADQQSLVEALDRKEGLMPEIVNPKKETGVARLEGMMQDLAKAVPASEVGVTKFPVRDIFAATKNKLTLALEKVRQGNFSEHLAATEGVLHWYTRKMLAEAGVNVNVEGETRYAFEDLLHAGILPGIDSEVVRGIPYQEGARIAISPFWAMTSDEVREKTNNVMISDRSFVIIEGERVFFDNVEIDGAIEIRLRSDQELRISNLKVKNLGWEFVPLTAAEIVDGGEDLTEDIRMR